MNRFVPKEKLSRRARRELDSQQRKFWTVPPATKVIESKKHYSRKRKSRDHQSAW